MGVDIDKTRRDQQATGVNFFTASGQMGADGRDVTEGRLTLTAVLKGMEALSDDQRALMTLVCIEGASYKEASETLLVPIGTVMSRLARARQSLNAQLGGSDPIASISKENTGE